MGKLHGTDGARGIAVDRFDPVLAGNIGRTAAARGVPKRAENAALIPHMMTCLRSSSGK